MNMTEHHKPNNPADADRTQESEDRATNPLPSVWQAMTREHPPLLKGAK